MEEQPVPRPASVSAGPPPPAQSTAQSIPVVCRFVPHDQWFLTHLAPYWKGKHIKHHILARCLNLEYTPPNPPVPFTPREEEQRPPSPITFAPDPRERPASPILFANIRVRNPLSSDEDDDSLDEWDDDLSGMSDKGKAHQGDSHDEADDSFDEGGGGAPQGGRVLPSRSTSVPSSTSLPPASLPSATASTLPTDRTTVDSHSHSHATARNPSKLLQKLTSSPPAKAGRPRPREDTKVVPSVAHLSFCLIRYTTGQILEDEYPLSDHDIQPHEMLELHFSFMSTRKDSRPGVYQATSKFPFPLLIPPPKQINGKSKRKRLRLQEMIAAHSIRIVQLPRSMPQAYVLPYWEGWVRILRYVSRDEADYVYGGNYPLASSSSRGTPGAAQYGGGMWGSQSTHLIGEMRENDLDANLALSFGLGGKQPKAGQPATVTHRRTDQHPRSRYEWRDRWLVVRDGWIFLMRDRSDLKPSHQFPLTNLYMLRDADRLTESIDSYRSTRNPREPLRPPKEPAKERPLPSTPRDKTHKPEPLVLNTARSPSPDSTLKGVPVSSPTRSGYGHGKHQLGRHVLKTFSISRDDDGYHEDDENDRKKREAHAAKKRAETHRQHQQHHHGASGSRKHESGRPRRDLTDPAVRARINPDTFIPNSKDEADLLGMRIICAKFLHPLPSTKLVVPDPFDGMPTNDPPKQYTNTGPSLADVIATIPVGIVGVLAPEERQPKERSQHSMSYDQAASRQGQGNRLHSKGSAPSSLSADFGPNHSMHKSLSTTADRRPSLPSMSQHAPVIHTPSLNANANVSSATLSFSSIFGTKDKEEKRREKEARAAKKRAEKERKAERDMDTADATASSISWKLPLGKKSKDRGCGATTPQSTVGTIDDDVIIVSMQQEITTAPGNAESLRLAQQAAKQEETNTRFRPVDDSDNSDDGGDPFPKFTRPPGLGSDDEFLDYRPHYNASPFGNITSSSASHAGTSVNLPGGNDDPEVVQQSDSDSGSISLSSPAFAREGGGGDDGDSELDIDLGIRRRRTGYRYGGFQKAEASGTKPPQQETPVPEVAIQEGLDAKRPAVIEKTETITRTTTEAPVKRPTARFEPLPKLEPKRRIARRGEWIIMDFGNDAAYHSLLRILHRHTDQPITSSFVPDLRSLVAAPRSPVPESAPPTPPPKDTVFEKSLPPSPSPRKMTAVDNSHLHSPASSLRGRSHSDAAFMPQSRLSRAGPYSDDENDNRSMLTPMASLLRPQNRPKRSSSMGHKELTGAHSSIPRGLGAYPYPEWRLQAVHRAKRSGLGQVNRPLEIMLLAMNDKSFAHFNPADPVFNPPDLPLQTQERGEEEDAEEDAAEGDQPVPDSEAEEEDEDENEEEDDGLLFTSESEDEDRSEMEWQAWSADLSRQMRLRRDRRSLESILMRPMSPVSSDTVGPDRDEKEATTLQNEGREFVKERIMREPFGVITSPVNSEEVAPGVVTRQTEGHHENDEQRQERVAHRYPPSSFSAATLSSRSSNESLPVRNRAQSQDICLPSGTSVASSATGSPHSAHSHNRGHSHSISQTMPTKSSRAGSRHSLLHHSSSMQTSLRIPTESLMSVRDSSMKRPSMPSISSTTTTTVTEQTFAVSPNSFGMASEELRGQDHPASGDSNHPPPSGFSPPIPMPMSSSYESRYVSEHPLGDMYRPGSPISRHRTPSNVSLVSGSPPLHSSLRRQGSNFSMSHQSLTGTSIGGHSNYNTASNKPSILRKKSSDRDLEPNNRSRGKLPLADIMVPSKTSPRPKLTVATTPTSASTPLASQQAFVGSPPHSPTPYASGSGGRSGSRAVPQHNKSGSSLSATFSAEEEGAMLGSPGTSGGDRKAKKKKSGAFGKFVKGFDFA